MKINKKSLFILFMLLLNVVAFSQKREVSGTVIDEFNQGMPGVNVIVLGTTVGTITDIEGRFSINVSKSDKLQISFIGYDQQVIEIGNKEKLIINIVPSAQQLDEVVVTALGIKREKKSLGYSVQEIKSEELLEAKEINLLNSLSGKVAGLQISKTASGAAGSSNVIIRGYTSINGSSKPLFVIDGIPVDNTSLGGEAGQWGGFDYGDGIADVNQEDIETVSVLKGPSAAALYGSRAANGAILITTKKGTKRKGIGIAYTSNVTFDMPFGLPEFQNEYGRGSAGSFRYNMNANENTDPEVDKNGTPYVMTSALTSWGPRMEGQKVIDWTGKTVKFSPQPNNISDFFKTGYTISNNISLIGNKKDATMRASFGHMKNSGILKNSSIQRYSSSLASTSNLTSYLKIDGRISYVRTSVENRPNLAESQDNIMKQLITMPRNISLASLKNYKDAYGKPVLYTGGSVHQQIQNPYWSINENLNADINDHLTGYFRLNYNITPWLDLMVRGGLDLRNIKITNQIATYNSYTSRLSWDGTYANTGDQYNISYNNSLSLSSEAMLTFHNKFSKNWEGRFNVMGSVYSYESNSLRAAGSEFKVPNMYSIINATQAPVGQGISEKMIQSVIAFGQLSWKDAMYLDLSLRTDWNSTMAPYDVRFSYPSVGTSIVFTDIPMFKFIKHYNISFAKIRGSIAQVGSGTSPYQTIMVYSQANNGGNTVHGQGLATLTDVRPPEGGLKPQKTNSWEIGTDIRFFDNRVAFDFSYYKMNTLNQIIVLGSTRTSGFSSQMVNAGNIQNSGIELTIAATPIKLANSFSWDIRLNFSKNESKVIKLTKGVKNYWLGSENSITITAKEGEAFGNMYGTYYRRDASGNRIIDVDGYPMIAKNEDGSYATKHIGDYQPDWVGGLNNSFYYKGFRASFLIDVKIGGDIYSKTNIKAARNGNSSKTLKGRQDWYSTHKKTTFLVDDNSNPLKKTWKWKWETIDGVKEGGYIAEGVTISGEKNTKPINPQQYWSLVASNTPVAEEFMYKGSFVKLREVKISYELPRNVLKHSPFNKANFSIVARNLFYLYRETEDFDPESSYNTSMIRGMESSAFPHTRNLGFNLVLSF